MIETSVPSSSLGSLVKTKPDQAFCSSANGSKSVNFALFLDSNPRTDCELPADQDLSVGRGATRFDAIHVYLTFIPKNCLHPQLKEGGLVCGAFNRSAIATRVERTSGFLMLVHLSGKHDAATVRERVGTAMSALPAHLRKTLTWDQGSEMSEDLQFKEETMIPVYFCDAHSPWQRGSNENTNRLFRQYFPKGTNLHLHGPECLAEVAAKINARPRESRNWEPVIALRLVGQFR